MSKVRSLSVHKNTLEKHKHKNLVKKMRSDVDIMSAGTNMAGYLIISWDDKTSANIAWQIDDKSKVTSGLLPAYAQSVLTRRLTIMDVESYLKEEH